MKTILSLCISLNYSRTWGSSQEAFALVKTKLTKPTLYSSYSADASSYGSQAILLLQVDDIWKPVAYTCNKFSDCFLIPDRLVPLLLDRLPPRILRFLLCLAR